MSLSSKQETLHEITINYHGYPQKGLLFDQEKDDRDIVYFKGAYVLHLLRQEIGEWAFWEGMKIYSQRYFDKEVTTSNFQETFEGVYKRSLDDFFLKWVY